MKSAGAWIANTAGQHLSNIFGEQRQTSNQIQAEKRANDEWWKRYYEQREYNSPSNLVRMVRQAGGNPLALFGSGYSPNPANPSIGGQSQPSMGAFNAAAANESALIQSQVNLNDAQAAKLRSDIDVNTSDISLNQGYVDFIKQQTLSESQLTRLRSIEADIQEATKGTQISTYIASLDKMLSEVKNIDQNTEYYRQLTFQVELARAVEQFNLDYLLPAQLQNINADTKVKIADAKLSEREVQHLTHLESQDKHELYLAYQRFAKEFGYTTFQYDLSEKSFDDIISSFVSYAQASDNWPDEGIESRKVSVEESKSTFHQTAAGALAFISALGSLKGKLGSWADDVIKKLGKSFRI